MYINFCSIISFISIVNLEMNSVPIYWKCNHTVLVYSISSFIQFLNPSYESSILHLISSISHLFCISSVPHLISSVSHLFYISFFSRLICSTSYLLRISSILYLIYFTSYLFHVSSISSLNFSVFHLY